MFHNKIPRKILVIKLSRFPEMFAFSTPAPAPVVSVLADRHIMQHQYDIMRDHVLRHIVQNICHP